MKNKKLLSMFVLSATFLSVMVGCGGSGTPTSSEKPATSLEPNVSENVNNSEPANTNYLVTFYYGLDHSLKLEKTSYNGAKVSLTNSQIASFAVEGYRISGYSTDAWKKDGITSDLDVYVQYTPLDKYTVTFLNPDGTEISHVEVTEGFSVADEDIPTSREVTTSTGYYFAGWDDISLTEGVEEDVVITATEKQADGVIPKVSSVTIDGTRDNSYVKIGDLTHFVNGKVATDWAKDAKGIDATLYASWDGDFIYYFVEVTDPTVVTFGKDYYATFDNNWLGDKVELWSSINGTYEMTSVDALGHTIRHHSFSDYIRDNNLFAATLVGDDVTNYKDGKPAATNATGYNVEFAMPAYTPTDKNVENCEKLISKDFLHLSLQINSADSVNEEMINNFLTNGVELDKTAIGQIWTGKQIGNEKALADEDNTWAMILG